MTSRPGEAASVGRRPALLARSGSLAGLAVVLALVAYVGWLVVAQYRSRLALEESRHRQLAEDTDKQATAVGYFLTERQDDLRHLGDSREPTAYFENEALGMSPEYGLKASLFAVQDLFDRLRATKLLAGAPIYSRVVFFDVRGGVLVASGAEPVGGEEKAWGSLLPRGPSPALSSSRIGEERQLVVSIPFDFKGRRAGSIVAWIPVLPVYAHFVGDRPGTAPTALAFGQAYLVFPERAREGIPEEFAILSVGPGLISDNP